MSAKDEAACWHSADGTSRRIDVRARGIATREGRLGWKWIDPTWRRLGFAEARIGEGAS